MICKRTVCAFGVTLMFFLSNAFAGSYKGLEFNEHDLEVLAEVDGYGYKYANLQELKKLASKFNEDAGEYQILVPDVVGIPSGKIHDFLGRDKEFNVLAEWESLIEYHLGGVKFNKIIEDKKFPSSFLDERAKFELKLSVALDRMIKDAISSGVKLNELFGVKGVDELLEDARIHGEFLMVRSTGKEDTRKLANAGGNESKADIAPQVDKVLQAIKEVVISYFGEKSLKQRLGAGDISIFNPIPFTPVLIQKMIKEISAKLLPKCGVMFTEEAEGGASRYAKEGEYPIKTSGIAIIQAAYGFNGAVVNSLIPVDTYYVDENNEIYSVIRPKTYRMMPTGGGEFDLVKNPTDVVRCPALSHVAIHTLKTFANVLELYYGYPMDVEYVVNEELASNGKKTIYIVQARPIVHNPNMVEPSYLSNPNAIPSDKKVYGESIGVAGGATRKITSKDEIVVAANIGDALNAYQNVPDNKKVQAIIVGAMAPATSHEATTFRSESKSVIYIPQWQVVEKWLDGDAINFIVCPQQGLVINTESLPKEVLAIESGWINYPVSPFMSLDLNLEDLSIEELLPEGKTVRDIGVYIAQHKKKNVWTEQLKIIKKGEESDAQFAIAVLVYYFDGIIREKIKRTPELLGDPDMKLRIKQLRNNLYHLAHNVKSVLKYSPQDKEAFAKRLFPIRFLESVLYQQPDLDSIINAFSAKTVIFTEFVQEQKIIQELKEKSEAGNKLSKASVSVDPRSIQYLKLRDIALSPGLESQWTEFIALLNANMSEGIDKQFKELFFELNEFDLVPLWFHTSFPQAFDRLDKDVERENLCSELVKYMSQEVDSQREFLTKIKNITEQVRAINVAAFSEPKNFGKQWGVFNKALQAFTDESFISAYKGANNLAKLAAVNALRKIVDQFDLSIKSITGNPIYPVEGENGKLVRFGQMLNRYFDLLKVWAALGFLVDQLSDYFKYIDIVLKKSDPTAKDLQPSERFNVSVFTIGSEVNLGDLAKPTTYEDAFTTIHQCLLMTVSVLSNKSGADKIKVPEWVALFSQDFIKKIGATSIGIDLSKNGVIFYYNKPIRNHSAQFEVRYDKKDNSIAVLTRFTGHDSDRWYRLALWVNFIKCAQLVGLDVKAESIFFSFKVKKGENYAPLLAKLDQIIKWTDNRPASEVEREIEAVLPGKQRDQCIRSIIKYGAYQAFFALTGGNHIFKYLEGGIKREIVEYISKNSVKILASTSPGSFAAFISDPSFVKYSSFVILFQNSGMFEPFLEKFILSRDYYSFNSRFEAMLKIKKFLLPEKWQDFLSDILDVINKLIQNNDYGDALRCIKVVMVDNPLEFVSDENLRSKIESNLRLFLEKSPLSENLKYIVQTFVRTASEQYPEYSKSIEDMWSVVEQDINNEMLKLRDAELTKDRIEQMMQLLSTASLTPENSAWVFEQLKILKNKDTGLFEYATSLIPRDNDFYDKKYLFETILKGLLNAGLYCQKLLDLAVSGSLYPEKKASDISINILMAFCDAKDPSITQEQRIKALEILFSSRVSDFIDIHRQSTLIMMVIKNWDFESLKRLLIPVQLKIRHFYEEMPEDKFTEFLKQFEIAAQRRNLKVFYAEINDEFMDIECSSLYERIKALNALSPEESDDIHKKIVYIYKGYSKQDRRASFLEGLYEILDEKIDGFRVWDNQADKMISGPEADPWIDLRERIKASVSQCDLDKRQNPRWYDE